LEGETIIATTPKYAYLYARNVIEGRWVEGEPIIAAEPEYAYMYARDIINGRWLEGELTIMFSKHASKYGKLCEIM
jgi:hypothetical protein